ncbi:MAG: UDP-glucose 4-epimerase GalE [Phycisphaerales bacterium]|nr:UDP-glucose 4-epimerase GalE [Phycisphaerales bacterium]
MNVLVTGGAGYIGSHAVQRLLRDGHTVTVLDNLHRGHAQAVLPPAELIVGEVGDTMLVEKTLTDRKIDCVMHFAALAYVGESVEDPLWYYRNNTLQSINLISAIDRVGVQKMVFSSTCATYGEPAEDQLPLRETCPQHPISPYGRSKLAIEHVLFDYARACELKGKPFGFAAPRYFNVAGADRSGVLGEDHTPETHLIPVVLQAALGLRDGVKLFGTDYLTPDGTCIRDYVHVEDLVDAHVLLMDAIQPGDRRVYNLGIGRGYSVREIIESAKRVSGVDFDVEEVPRREGDPPSLYAEPSKISRELGWKAQISDVDEVVASAYHWYREHPKGYE